MFLVKEKPMEGLPKGYSIGKNQIFKVLDKLLGVPEKLFTLPFTFNRPIDRPIFVIGTFRSGTTILEKILAEHSTIGHFSYLTSLFDHAPMLGTGLIRTLQYLNLVDKDGTAFLHNPRFLSTLESPYECEKIWSRYGKCLWDNKCDDMTLDENDSHPVFEAYLKNLIQRHLLLQKATRFIHKNPINNIRVPYLHKVFSDARFVYITRDPLETILSHYHTAKRFHDKIYHDASLQIMLGKDLKMDTLTPRIKTSNYQTVLKQNETHILLGIAAQWAEMQNATLAALERIPAIQAQTLTVAFEDLASSPNTTLNKIWQFIDVTDSESQAITECYQQQLKPAPLKASELEQELKAQIEAITTPVTDKIRALIK